MYVVHIFIVHTTYYYGMYVVHAVRADQLSTAMSGRTARRATTYHSNVLLFIRYRRPTHKGNSHILGQTCHGARARDREWLSLENAFLFWKPAIKFQSTLISTTSPEPRPPLALAPCSPAMASHVGEEGLDLFQEPADFYEPEKQATFATHLLQSGRALQVRLVGHNPLWVGHVSRWRGRQENSTHGS